MTTRHRVAQRPATEALVTLYDLDLAPVGGGSLHWTPGPLNSLTGNLIANPCVKNNTNGWTFGGTAAPTNSGLASTLGANYTLADYGSGYMRRSTGLTGAQYMEASYQIVPSASQWRTGAWLEVQARLQPWRCHAWVVLSFYDGGSSLISSQDSETYIAGYAENASAPSDASHIDDFTVVWCQAQIPANTATVKVQIRAKAISGTATDPYCLFTMSQVAIVNNTKNFCLPYMPASVVGQVMFGGTTYDPVPVQVDRVQWTGHGPIPRPQVTIPNIGGYAAQLMAAYKDLLGAKVTRRRTYKRALDGMPDADPTDYYGPEVWYIDRVATRTPEAVVFELASPFDIQGKMLPGRQMIRDVCTQTYRAWDPNKGFIYGSCPYAGSNYFKSDGTPTGSPDEDVCGRRTLTDCTLRFPGQPLPTWAFPGMVKTRT